MASKVPASKFKYLFGTPAQPVDCINGIALGSVSPDSNVIKATTALFAVPWKGTGSVAVIPVGLKGAVPEELPLILQDDAVNEFNFSPFLNDDTQLFATAGQDGATNLWKIPVEGLSTSQTQPFSCLVHGAKRLTFVEWHSLARNVLVSGAGDGQLKLWDVLSNTAVLELNQHKGQVTSLSWSYDGGVCATACKDKQLRVVDPRSNSVGGEVTAHQGAKGWRALWMGRLDRILSVGFSKSAQRELSLWDLRSLGAALATINLDVSPAAPMPFYDVDTSVLYLASKGEGAIKTYEVLPSAPHVLPLSEFKSPTPASGMALLPKWILEPMKCEVAKFLKLTSNGQVVPLRFEVPRQNMNFFHEDLYPDTWDGMPTGDSAGWFGGETNRPVLKPVKP